MLEPQDILIPDDEGDESRTPDPELEGALVEIERRCSAPGIKTERNLTYQGVFVWFPNGSQERKVFVGSLGHARSLLEQQFEDFVFLGSYVAVCSYKEGYFEAAIEPLRSASIFRLRKLFGYGPGEEGDRAIELTPNGEDEKIKIELRSSRQRLRFFDSEFRNRRPCLVIRNANIQRHDDALRLLEKIADSVFFEMDLTAAVTIGLARERKPPLLMRLVGVGPGQQQASLSVPKSAYDHDPISLYFYAKSASGMPLLQFLAFYQSIEYYMPIYSQNDAIKRLRNLMKDPTFDLYDDGDMTRLLSSIQVSRASGYGDERSQLRATLQSCLDAEELGRFLNSGGPISDFYSKGEWKAISRQQIPLKNEAIDLRVNVAERIYDIRNKIVHSKSDGGGNDQVLLPFSKEAEMLGFDIALIEFVSRKILIANSTNLAV
jgi:hypothetical protein